MKLSEPVQATYSTIPRKIRGRFPLPVNEGVLCWDMQLSNWVFYDNVLKRKWGNQLISWQWISVFCDTLLKKKWGYQLISWQLKPVYQLTTRKLLGKHPFISTTNILDHLTCTDSSNQIYFLHCFKETNQALTLYSWQWSGLHEGIFSRLPSEGTLLRFTLCGMGFSNS